MHLSELKTGESAIIIKVLGHGGFRRRILEMGFVKGQKVKAILNAPLKDPIKYQIMEYEVSLRRSEAQMIEIEPYTSANLHNGEIRKGSGRGREGETANWESAIIEEIVSKKGREINLALVGNPNSGKTSLFNALSGGHEHVGNYSGVTVDAKMGHFTYGGYRFNITDLPGTYALTAYSPEEIYVRKYLIEHAPDVILNSVVSSNLERNLYLTTELIDINQKTVVALNMYDELEKGGAQLDYIALGKLIGIPMVPVVAKERKGLEDLLDAIIDVYESAGAAKGYTAGGESSNKENSNKEGENLWGYRKANTYKGKIDVESIVRHIHIKYSPAIEREIALISKEIKAHDDVFPTIFPPRYWTLKLLEGDKEVEKHLRQTPYYTYLIAMRDAAVERVRKQLDEDLESAITDEKYGFISGALKETYTPGSNELKRNTALIDSIVTNKVFGFPIFLFLMWLMFNATFSLGAYPQEWIESLVAFIGNAVSGAMHEGPVKDLIVNGIIGGVGSVIVFLPNILILYLFISMMEDSGYMARAAFIMDKLMHKMGLHGKSFIPLIMGFGCNVPAIMSARTIESPSSRIITVLITPFMLCSARLPVFILFAGIFFPGNSGSILMLLYLFGILLAIITAKMLRKFMFREDDTPFVMELPPYRIPTFNATLQHMWEKCAQYLKKIGSVILFASIIIWFLGYYPRPDGNSADLANPSATEVSATGATVQMESIAAERSYNGSYLERIGKFCEPVLEPLGLNWKSGVALISGAAAKEIIVSTFGVLYADSGELEGQGEINLAESVGEDEDALLRKQLIVSEDFTTSSAVAFMIFALLYFPCIATLAAIANETGSWKWALFSFVYSCSLAWLLSFLAYNISNLFS